MSQVTITITAELADDEWPTDPEARRAAVEEWLQIMSDTTETGIGTVTVREIGPEHVLA